MNAKMLSDLRLSAYRRLYFEDETADDSVQTLREAWEEQRSKPGIIVIRIARRNVLSNIFTKFPSYIKTASLATSSRFINEIDRNH